MERPFKKFKASDFDWAVHRAKDRIRNVEQRFYEYNFDPRKKERLSAQLCVVCFYGSKIAGRAMTYWYCGICGEKEMHSSTGVPTLCKMCAHQNALCCDCGADIKLRERRKLEWEDQE